MGWAAAGAGLGLLKAQQDQENQRKANLVAAEQSRYAPMLAMGGVNSGPGELSFGAPTAFDRVLQGGVMGGMAGQQFGGSESTTNTDYSSNGEDTQTSSNWWQNKSGKR